MSRRLFRPFSDSEISKCSERRHSRFKHHPYAEIGPGLVLPDRSESLLLIWLFPIRSLPSPSTTFLTQIRLYSLVALVASTAIMTRNTDSLGDPTSPCRGMTLRRMIICLSITTLRSLSIGYWKSTAIRLTKRECDFQKPCRGSVESDKSYRRSTVDRLPTSAMAGMTKLSSSR